MYFKIIAIFILAASRQIPAQETSNYCANAKINYYNLSKINYESDTRYDVLHYHIDITVDHASQLVNGKVKITAMSQQDNLSDPFIDLKANMTISRITDGAQVELTFSHVGDVVNIDLLQPLKTGDEFQMIIHYSGSPESDGFGSFKFTTHGNGRPLIWTLSQPYGAKNWWPCKDTPADKADSADIWITCDESLTPVSNGVLQDVINNDNRTHTYKWSTKYPIAQYLISMAIAGYSLYENFFVDENLNDTLRMVHYNFPERHNAAREDELDRVIPMLEVFTEKFGTYPFFDEKYGHAEFTFGGAMEHQTISSMGVYFTDITAHELAHQWFGDKITCKDWHNIWLNEGFAEYSEAVYFEAVRGKEVYKNNIATKMIAAKKAVGSIYVEDISSVSNIFSGNRTYQKGAVVLHMLRGVIGDENFWDVMYKYANDEKLSYSVAVIEDFKAIAEEVSGIDLSYFFDQWLYGENYPFYNYYWEYSELGNSQYEVVIDIEQSENSNPVFFTMPMDIKIEIGNESEYFEVFNDKKKQRFNFTVNTPPTDVIIDPDDWILKDVFLLTDIGSNNVPVYFEVKQNYPNPFNPSTTLTFSIGSISDVSISIFDLTGKKLFTLLDKEMRSGTHSVEFNPNQAGRSLSSGIYIYRIKTALGAKSKKMIYLK